MCRLYGQIALNRADAKDFLVYSERSFFLQSHYRKTNPQRDGWGLGFFDGPKAKIVKSRKPIVQEKNRFFDLASRTRSKVIIGHLRAASNPRGLLKKKLIGVENSQPFGTGSIVFAHNGTLQIPDEVLAHMGPFAENVKGVNDSEVYFWHWMKWFKKTKSAPKALELCIREIWRIWAQCRRLYPHKKYPYTGLNTLISDGKSLHAFCHYPYGSSAEQRSLFGGQKWGVMSAGLRDDRWIVSSEDLDSTRWERLKDGEIVSARIESGKIKLNRTLVRI